MAFTTTLIGSNSGTEHKAYNIDWSVGLIGSNARDDVMLTQALLRILYYELLGFNDGLDPPPDATDPISVDGIKGPITQKHIVHLQKQLVERGQKVVQDGTFDPFRKSQALSTITKSQYAFELLNSACIRFCLQHGMSNYDTLQSRQDIPVTLRNALTTVKKTARQYTYVQVTVPATGGA